MNHILPQQIKDISSLMPICTGILQEGDKLPEKDYYDFRNEAENFTFQNYFHFPNSLFVNNFLLLTLSSLAFPFSKLKREELDGVYKEIKEVLCFLDADVYSSDS